MIHYKDKTFCPHKGCAQFKNCHRALTDKVRADAVAWWGNEDAPICTYLGKPGCFEAKQS